MIFFKNFESYNKYLHCLIFEQILTIDWIKQRKFQTYQNMFA